MGPKAARLRRLPSFKQSGIFVTTLQSSPNLAVKESETALSNSTMAQVIWSGGFLF